MRVAAGFAILILYGLPSLAAPFEPSTHPWKMPFRASGLIAGDFDGNGDADLLVTPGNFEGSTYFLRNEKDLEFAVPRELGIAWSTTLQVVDLDADGVLDLVGLRNTRLTLHRGRGDGSFLEEGDILHPDPVRSFALLPSRGFRRPDLVLLDETGSTVERLEASRSGWTSVESVSVGPNVEQILLADFEGDGDEDLIAYVKTTQILDLFRRDRDGWVRSGFHRLLANTESVTTGDFDGDGSADLVSAHRWVFTPSTIEPGIAFHFGNGAGGFLPWVWATRRDQPDRMIAVDFDGNGRDDLVTESSGIFASSPDRVIVATPLPFPFANSDVAVADFDRDGSLDLAGCDGALTAGIPECRFPEEPHTITFLRGAAGGGLATAPLTHFTDTVLPSLVPRGEACGDLDSDGFDDLVLATAAGPRIFLARGEGRWEPGPAIDPVVLPEIRDPVVADWDGDGRLDLLAFSAGRTEILVARGDGSARFDRARTISLGPFRGLRHVAADLDGDERPELVVQCDVRPFVTGGDSLFIFRSEGTEILSRAGAFPLAGHTVALGVRRTAEGRHEVGVAQGAYLSPIRPILQVLRSSPEGSPTISPPFDLPLLVQSLDGIDQDLDSEEEWMSLATNAWPIQPCGVYDGHLLHFIVGESGLQVLHDTPAGEVRVLSSGLELGDFDADGRSDVIVSGYQQEARLFRGTGEGFAFHLPLLGKVHDTSYPVAGDFDEDRRLDLVFIWVNVLETLMNVGEEPASEDLWAIRLGPARDGAVQVGDGARARVRDVVPSSLRLGERPATSWGLLREDFIAHQSPGCPRPGLRLSVRDVQFPQPGPGRSPWLLTGRTEDGRALSATVCPAPDSSSPRRSNGDGISGVRSPRLVSAVTFAGEGARLRFHTSTPGAHVEGALYDVRGRRRQTWRWTATGGGWNEQELDPGDILAPGIYFLHVEVEGAKTTLRWVALPSRP